MGLQINTNVASLKALNNLRATDRQQQTSLERLSTGLRINTAADDPSGFVISEQLRAQIGSLNQAIENSQNASNLVGTAEAALKEVNSLLVQVRESIIFALNSNSAEQISAEQDAVDNALTTIDRIAQTTKFADTKLLDGSSAIAATSTVGSGIRDLAVNNAQFDGVSSVTLSVNLSAVASRAGDVFTSGGSAVGFRSATADVTLRVTGTKGTQDVTVASGLGSAALQSAVNAFTGNTGVYASAGRLYSVEFGSSETVSVEVVSGSFNVGAGGTSFDTNTNQVLSDTGVDASATVNGATVSANGNNLRIVSAFFTGDITLKDAATTSSTLSFKLKKSGLVFQLNTSHEVSNRTRIGIRSTTTSTLGKQSRTLPGQGSNTVTIDGFLSSLKSGGTNDLSTDAANALRIVDIAINQVSDSRAILGAFQKQRLESNIASLSVASENLSSSLSDIRDLDFASETAEFTKQQILFQAGTAVLAQANQIPQAVLALLR